MQRLVFFLLMLSAPSLIWAEEAANSEAMSARIDELLETSWREANVTPAATSEDAEFMRRAQVLVDQFDEYAVVGDLHVNGRLTLGENIADLGGLTIAYTSAGVPVRYRLGTLSTQARARPVASRGALDLVNIVDISGRNWSDSPVS